MTRSFAPALIAGGWLLLGTPLAQAQARNDDIVGFVKTVHPEASVVDDGTGVPQRSARPFGVEACSGQGRTAAWA